MVWVVVPVVVNVFVMLAYVWPAVVEYLHLAFSFVVTAIVVLVVPADRLPEGEPALNTGGVVSDVNGGRTAATASILCWSSAVLVGEPM